MLYFFSGIEFPESDQKPIGSLIDTLDSVKTVKSDSDVRSQVTVQDMNDAIHRPRQSGTVYPGTIQDGPLKITHDDPKMYKVAYVTGYGQWYKDVVSFNTHNRDLFELSDFYEGDGFHYIIRHNPLASVHVKTRAHAYHASKATNLQDEMKVLRSNTAQEAKMEGLSIELRSDWDDVKVAIYYSLCLQQALEDTTIRDVLESTKGKRISDSGETHSDSFWSAYNDGRDMSGRIWTQIRDLIFWE